MDFDQTAPFREWGINTLPRVSSAFLPQGEIESFSFASDGWSAQRLGDKMTQLGIGFFQVDETTHYLALLDERISDHVRWLTAIDTSDASRHRYFRIATEQAVGATFERQNNTFDSFTALLGQAAMATMAQYDYSPSAANFIDNMSLLVTCGARHKAIGMSLTQAQAERLFERLPEIHLAMAHPADWLLDNPTLRDLPQDIALRMAGFGPLLSAVQDAGEYLW